MKHNKKMLRWVLCVAPILCGACGDYFSGCIPLEMPGVNVVLIDSASQQAYRGTVTVTVREGVYTDSISYQLPALGDTVSRGVWLAHDRAGDYSVEVRAPEFETWRRDNVHVEAGDCSANTVSLIAMLRRKPDPAPVARDTAPAIQTDALWYVLERNVFGWQTTIRFTYRNVAPDTVFVSNCNRQLKMDVQKLVNGAWVSYWHTIYLACQSPPIVIPPGATTSETFALFGAPPGRNMSPNFVSEELTGVYRLVLNDLSWDSAGTRPVPVANRTSNTFVMKRMD